MELKTFVIDIDDTLLYSLPEKCDKCGRNTYALFTVDKSEIDYINKLYDAGYTIILWTGRNWDCYQLTKEQLKQAEIKYHELIMGKLQGIYIDKDAKISLKEFVDELS